MGANTIATTPDDIRRVLDALRHIVRILRLTAARARQDHGLTAAQMFILQKLGDETPPPGQPGLTVNELALRTHTDQSSVSVVVRRLAGAKLVERRTSDRDRRQTVVSLATEGRRVLRTSPTTAQDELIQALRRLGAKDRGLLARLLESLVVETGMAEEPPPLFFEDEPPPGTTTIKHSGRIKRS